MFLALAGLRKIHDSFVDKNRAFRSLTISSGRNFNKILTKLGKNVFYSDWWFKGAVEPH